MSWLETSLARLEARLQSLIEGDAGRGPGSRHYQDELMHHVLQAMQAGLQQPPDNNDPGSSPVTAPDLYTLVLPPAKAQALQAKPDILDGLARKLEEAAQKTGIQFPAPPVLRVVADPAALRLSVQAQYSHTGQSDSFTAKLDELPAQLRAQAESLPNAFLIVNGLDTFPLTEMVVGIGRDPANHLVLEDPRVSRNHAQLRLVQGRFVIFDLDSTGGTFINGVPVSSHALSPGDVISLAGVPLVFGQEVAFTSGQTQELPVDPQSPLEIL